jgi:hypothetical protein
MTQEDKDLLVKDLCARLPYGVKGNYQNSDDELLRRVTIVYRYLEPNGMVMTGDVKPYLFPLSSMTEEQKEEYYNLCDSTITEWGNPIWFDSVESIDWLNKNHFDYRGLIKKGLAIDCTNLNIY